MSFAVIFKDEHENHTTYEVWLVIQFFNAKNVRPLAQTYAVTHTRAFLEQFVWKMFEHF
jgi:hypothetical protein